jgi:hypothetical protein
MRWLEYVVFLVIVLGLARPVGFFLARVGLPAHVSLSMLPGKPISSAADEIRTSSTSAERIRVWLT